MPKIRNTATGEITEVTDEALAGMRAQGGAQGGGQTGGQTGGVPTITSEMLQAIIGSDATTAQKKQAQDIYDLQQEELTGGNAIAATSLRKEYDSKPETKSFKQVKQQWENMQSSEGGGASDVSLLYSYIKMLDPNTAVREGELALAGQAESLPGEIVKRYNKTVKGAVVSPRLRKQILAEGAILYNTVAEQQKLLSADFSGYATSSGLDPKQVVGSQEIELADVPKLDSKAQKDLTELQDRGFFERLLSFEGTKQFAKATPGMMMESANVGGQTLMDLLKGDVESAKQRNIDFMPEIDQYGRTPWGGGLAGEAGGEISSKVSAAATLESLLGLGKNVVNNASSGSKSGLLKRVLNPQSAIGEGEAMQAVEASSGGQSIAREELVNQFKRKVTANQNITSEVRKKLLAEADEMLKTLPKKIDPQEAVSVYRELNSVGRTIKGAEKFTFGPQKANMLRDAYTEIFAKDFPQFVENTQLYKQAYNIPKLSKLPFAAKIGLGLAGGQGLMGLLGGNK